MQVFKIELNFIFTINEPLQCAFIPHLQFVDFSLYSLCSVCIKVIQMCEATEGQGCDENASLFENAHLRCYCPCATSIDTNRASCNYPSALPTPFVARGARSFSSANLGKVTECCHGRAHRLCTAASDRLTDWHTHARPHLLPHPNFKPGLELFPRGSSIGTRLFTVA